MVSTHLINPAQLPMQLSQLPPPYADRREALAAKSSQSAYDYIMNEL